MGGPPDINPYISMGMGGGQDPTYESYLDMINKTKENYMGPQSPITSPNFARPGVGIQQTLNPLSQTGLAGLANLRGNTTGPVDNLRGQGLPQGGYATPGTAGLGWQHPNMGAMGAGQGALQGPTQRQIQQGIGALA